MSQGGPVTVEYDVRHPEQIDRLVFYGSHPGHHAISLPEDEALDEAFTQLIKVGWERPTPEFRRVFTYLMIPGATEEQMGWLDELQRRAVTADVAISARRQRGEADVSDLLGAVTAPTLVIHSLRDRMNDFAYARFLASHIPGARLVGLESDNHILLEDEPAWPVFLREVTEFLAEGAAPAGGDDLHEVLSAREIEVLSLAAHGRDNAEIAAELTLSVRTVERHLQNIYDKLDLHGKAARTGAVTRLLAAR
jgi:pimeloyl-ACP methyl ester carboxylesterase/DNA-binding CsgD family transcriptional regulator